MKYIAEGEAVPFDYGLGQHVRFPRFMMPPFLRFLKDRNTENLTIALRDLQNRYKNTMFNEMYDRISYILGDIDAQTYLSLNPIRPFDEGIVPGLYEGYRLELNGADPQLILEAYSTPGNWNDRCIYKYIEWRIAENQKTQK